MKILSVIFMISSLALAFAAECGKDTFTIEGKRIWPWMVAIIKSKDEKPAICGGVLINRQFVLTTARCIQNVKEFKVRIGGFDLSKLLSEDTPYTVESNVSNITIHPDYESKGFGYNDIAILKLQEPLTGMTKSVCLPEIMYQRNITIRDKGVLLGWGFPNSDTYEVSVKLKEIGEPIYTARGCEGYYKRILSEKIFKRAFPQGISGEQLICAGNIIDNDQPACYGDTGGPLMLKTVDSRWVVIGILSVIGGKCGEFPSLYANVENYLDWIKENTQ